MDSNKKSYNQSLDILRIISILAVVLIHTTTRTIEASSNNLDQFTFTLFLNQTARFAVPVFFFISGFALELNYHLHQNYWAYLKKRVGKIFLPYLFWSLFYMLFVYPQNISYLPNFLLTGNASYQLYFIPALLIFYVLFPLLRKIHKYSLYSIFLLQIILLYIDYYLYPLPFPYVISVALLNIFFFIYGIFSRYQSIKLSKVAGVVLAAVSGITVYYQGKNNYTHSHNYLSFYSQWRPSILFYSIFLISIISKISFQNQNLIKSLSRLSFFVFFVHVAVIELIWPQIRSQFDQFWFDPVFFVLVSSLSFVLSYLVSRLPVVSKLTG